MDSLTEGSSAASGDEQEQDNDLGTISEGEEEVSPLTSPELSDEARRKRAASKSGGEGTVGRVQGKIVLSRKASAFFGGVKVAVV